MQVTNIIRALPVVLCITAPAPAAPSAQGPAARYRVNGDNVWFYQEPPPAGRRVARLLRGAVVSGGATRDEWVQVSLDGWIFSSSVGPSPRPDFDLAVTRAPNENLRVTPGGTVVAELAQGFGLKRVGQDSSGGGGAGRWTHVTRDGWVQRAALTVVPDAIAGRTGSAGDTALSPGLGARGEPGIDSSRAQPTRMTTLYRAPDGPEAGTVAAETPLRVISRNGEWARVQFEGWVKGGELQAAPSGVLVGVTAAELRAEPQRYVGQVLRWRLEFIAVQKSDDLRPDIPSGATYVLARGPLPERGFVYVIVPEAKLAAVRALAPLAPMQIIARVRSGRSRYLGNPIVELITLEGGSSS
jgi:hypothetical protein